MRVKKEFAKYADYCIEKLNCNVLIFCMERMDYPPSKDIYNLMKHKEKARLIPSNDYNLEDISGLLSKLKFLVSTRYHACVLSMCSSIPMITVSHDIRCESLFKETEIMEYYIPHDTNNLYDVLVDKTNLLLKNENKIKDKIKNAYPMFLERCMQNRKILKDWFEKVFGNS
jgi:polysaccharide pyruvyl transferase WcaK-like protein